MLTGVGCWFWEGGLTGDVKAGVVPAGLLPEVPVAAEASRLEALYFPRIERFWRGRLGSRRRAERHV